VKLADFYDNPSYQRRVVVFVDILGWRSKIEEAGDDPAKIGRLRRIILGTVRLSKIPNTIDARVTTFSDHVVFSQPLAADAGVLLTQIAVLQLHAAVSGVLVRGAVTIGNILHDDEVVFGPALNRAYHLENQIAKVPRIVLDSDMAAGLRRADNLLVEENGIYFLDPFTVPFASFVMAGEWANPDDLLKVGLPPGNPQLKNVPGDRVLMDILEVLKQQLRIPLADHEMEQITWLSGRIAGRLGGLAAG
jgi:hypothetical protein